MLQCEEWNYEKLLQKSKEMGLPFAKLLGGAVLEEAVRRIGASEYGARLRLKNSDVLGREQYERKLTLHLEYACVVGREQEEMEDAAILKELSNGLFLDVFGANKAYGVTFAQKGSVRKGRLSLQLLAQISEWKAPIVVSICLQRRETPSQKESICSLLSPDSRIFYYENPKEEVLRERFMEIVTKLELIQNIGAYYDVYRILEGSVDGRKVAEAIGKQCESSLAAKEPSLLAVIAAYADYSYMKKKWKVFLRSMHGAGPSWEEAVARFIGFFGPVWEAVAGDYVFFGDWMPELNRFL